jgi:hypothetical protein
MMACPGMVDCKYCRGTGFVDVLNIWAIAKSGLDAYQDAETLPLIKNRVRCHKCHGEQCHGDDMDDLSQESDQQ